MVRKSNTFYLFLIGILLIVIVILFFVIANTQKSKAITGDVVNEPNNNPITGMAVRENANSSNLSNVISSDKIHFKYLPIKYYIYSPNDDDSINNYTKCSEIKEYNIYKAFSTIQNDTNQTVTFSKITYEEKKANPEVINDNTILIRCHNYKSNGVYIVEGEARPIMESETVIKNGEVDLYHNGMDVKGDSSSVVHEIMHVFGYSHITLKASIMNPVSRHVMKLDQNITDDLVDIYS
jgi:hypothetical protein